MKKAISLLSGALLGLAFLGTSAHAESYTVKNGDTLWKIAAASGVSFSELQSLNPSAGDMIYPGQTIRLPDTVKAYTVKPNDTFWKVALKFGVTTRSLIDANPQIANPDILNTGDLLRIPAKNLSASSAVTSNANGQFPLKANTYQPFTDNYAEARTWSQSGEEIRSHEGVDILAAKGTPVYAAKAGKVIRYGWNELGGWRLTVQVDDSTAFYYAHLSGYADGIALGSTIKQGQLIGYVGNTGYGPEGTEGQFDPHLHFGIYQTSPWKAVDPYHYLKSIEN
ncbi:M23 family metallopeptidase [Paenibacillus ginsengarvi]|uniref:M23 family metallopeptidase n=1 Tax=Paenibacillus ginsengarvi TaxID=400777 RepID=UPI001315A431|nr:M23 family metallopeptidase [Paenibacillus ginsengarvi]